MSGTKEMKKALKIFQDQLDGFKDQGIYKVERVITSRQGREIEASDPKKKDSGSQKLINFCANNYLGLGGAEQLVRWSKEGLDSHGFGLNSVRFICGTQDIHKELERAISNFVGCEDAVLYAAAFDANAGLFETILNNEDVIISDKLNHASIIDGIRLCKAERKLYENNNMEELEEHLKASQDKRIRLIATDGVFSMDGVIANLKKITELAEKYDALVMIDDCHSTGFVGETGRGTAEYAGVFGKVDIITGTFGKALGGASGGFTACRKEIADMLRQKSRPYLFSNTVAPSIVYTELKVLEALERGIAITDPIVAAETGSADKAESPLKTLKENTKYFREELTKAGIDIIAGEHPIVPVMVYDEKKAVALADKLYDEGIYVIGFCYPVVPLGKARIRVQVSAAHTKADLDKAVAAFKKHLK